ncbi:MAG: hypothetical protein ACK4VY_02235 [Brevundimonas sp.]
MAAYQGAGRGLIPHFTEVDALGDVIQAMPNTHGHILVDGFHGAGKSTLARALGSRLNLPVLEADNLVKRQIRGVSDRYIDTLDQLALRAKLLSLASCVVDGVSALDIADAVPIAVKAHIYIKHLDRHGDWSDADEVELENEIDRFARPSALRVCLRRYHASRAPHLICDAIFLRQDTE